MITKIKKPISIALSILLIASCDKTETSMVEPIKAETVKDIPANPTDAPSGNKFSFYSFKNGKVANVDSSSTKWDIGFRSTSIIVNGGISGMGQASAAIVDGIFSDIKTVPANTIFVQDASSSLAIPIGSGKGWYNYTNNQIIPIAGKVILIKTTDGKYAKMEILSYYKGAPSTIDANSIARYYSFRFIYQPDGTTKFQ